MEIIKARSSGFCFGVRKAVETAYQLSRTPPDKNQATYMLGELIHSQTVIAELVAAGLRQAEEPRDIPAGSRVLIRAHGITPAVYRELESRNCTIVDGTCPYVTKIHRIVRQACEAGRTVLIAGNPGHPEVAGIVGECPRPAIVLPDRAAAPPPAPPEKPRPLGGPPPV
jgi:4-hydroxy-3-methylbut-2-enyl diphosphate reductase